MLRLRWKREPQTLGGKANQATSKSASKRYRSRMDGVGEPAGVYRVLRDGARGVRVAGAFGVDANAHTVEWDEHRAGD